MTVFQGSRFNRVLLFLVVIAASSQGDNVSLVLGPNPHIGLVQISHQGRTGLVCDDGFDREAAEVVCRQIGYPTVNPGLEVSGQYHKLPSHMTYILDDIDCHGNEQTLSQCRHSPWFQENCGEGETVAVFCEDNPCMSGSPCRHNGTCSKLSPAKFHCDCSPEFTGATCETDVNECTDHSDGCSHQCVNDVAGYHCECPDVELILSEDNHTCIGAGEEVTCTSQTMTISFDKSHYPGLQAKYVTLTDTTCQAIENSTHIVVTSPLDACGTKSKALGSNIVYENIVKSREEIVDGLISRVREVEVPFQCIVPVTENLEIPLKVDRSVLVFTAEGRGEFESKLELFHDKNYVLKPREKPFVVNPGDDVYAQLSLNSNGKYVMPFAVRCLATPNRNTTLNVYNLINNGCALDTTLAFHNSGDQTKEQFSFEAFKYIDNSPSVFLRCDVILCVTSDNTSRCSEGCLATNPGKREVRDTDNNDVIETEAFSDVTSRNILSSLGQSTLVVTAAATCAVSLIFLIWVIVYKKCIATDGNF